MKKILKIDSSSGIGGGQKIMFDIVKKLQNDFDFFILIPKGNFFKKYSKLNVSLGKLKSDNFFQIIKRIRKVFKKEKPSIVHCHSTRAAFWTRIALIGLESKIIYTLHGFHIVRKPFLMKWPLLFFERILNYSVNYLVCVSESDKELVLKYNIIPPQRIKVIKNGVKVNHFFKKYDKRKKKRSLGLNDSFIISSIGRLHEPKDFSTVLEAFKEVKKRTSNIKLLIIGDGPLKNKLIKKAKSLNIEKGVKFLGFREDIFSLINMSDIIVLSSKWEGMPLVLLEAGSFKKPVIASDISGNRELIKNKETGFLFKNTKDLVNKILKLYSSKESRTRMGKKAYKTISQNFSIKKMIKEYKRLYQEL